MSPKKFKLVVLVSGRGSNLQAIIDSIKKNDYKFYKSDICNKKILNMILKKHKPNVFQVAPKFVKNITNTFDFAYMYQLIFF